MTSAAFGMRLGFLERTFCCGLVFFFTEGDDELSTEGLPFGFDFPRRGISLYRRGMSSYGRERINRMLNTSSLIDAARTQARKGRGLLEEKVVRRQGEAAETFDRAKMMEGIAGILERRRR